MPCFEFTHGVCPVAGVSITKHLNAATRMVLDSCRTIVVWAVSLMLKWEKFCYINVRWLFVCAVWIALTVAVPPLQIIGFVILLAGTIIFNEIIYIPGLMPPKNSKDATVPLLDVEDMNANALGADSPLIPTMNALMTPTLSKATTTHQR